MNQKPGRPDTKDQKKHASMDKKRRLAQALRRNLTKRKEAGHGAPEKVAGDKSCGKDPP